MNTKNIPDSARREELFLAGGVVLWIISSHEDSHVPGKEVFLVMTRTRLHGCAVGEDAQSECCFGFLQVLLVLEKNRPLYLKSFDFSIPVECKHRSCYFVTEAARNGYLSLPTGDHSTRSL